MIITDIINRSFAATGDPCKLDGGSFFGLPHWYKYLNGVNEDSGACAPSVGGVNDIWLIALSAIEILLRVAIMVAIAYILVGGIKFIVSRANPEKTSRAKNTVVDALVGLVLAVAATALVSFVAGRFSE